MPPLGYSFVAAAALDADDRLAVLGGKGAALARMTEMGLPVPPGFTLTTSAARQVTGQGWFAELDGAIADGVAEMESATGCRLGDASAPLLVSVRSGAAVSMPGMMDTVLNVGMTDEVADALAASTGDPWFAWDTARRAANSYASVVHGVPPRTVRQASKRLFGPDDGRTMSPDELASATRRLRSALAADDVTIPADPHDQLRAAIGAVFESWGSGRARSYREVEGIDESVGTAATVQAMVFGNLGERSGTGVVFSRDPSTGAKGLVGDFLIGAQGEDVVVGTHPIRRFNELRSLWPEVAGRLEEAADRLERDLGDMVEVEFTVQEGRLWLLQVRAGARHPVAALRIAIDLAEDPTFPLDRAGALSSVAEILADPPTRPAPAAVRVPDEAVLTSGLGASPGRAVGRLFTRIDDAIDRSSKGESVVLVRHETAPADVPGIAVAVGLVTAVGGPASHAAVVARSWGIPAVVGADDLTVDETGIAIAGRRFNAGEVLTVDGDAGIVLLGDHAAEDAGVEEVQILQEWRRQM